MNLISISFQDLIILIIPEYKIIIKFIRLIKFIIIIIKFDFNSLFGSILTHSVINLLINFMGAVCAKRKIKHIHKGNIENSECN